MNYIIVYAGLTDDFRPDHSGSQLLSPGTPASAGACTRTASAALTLPPASACTGTGALSGTPAAALTLTSTRPLSAALALVAILALTLATSLSAALAFTFTLSSSLTGASSSSYRGILFRIICTGFFFACLSFSEVGTVSGLSAGHRTFALRTFLI